MRVFVLVAIRSGGSESLPACPPSVWHLQQCVRARSPSCYHATSGGYLWTADVLFRSLRRVPIDGEVEGGHTNASSTAHRFYFFSTLLDLGDNEEDAEVVSMLLTELCVAWTGTIAAHMEVCRVGYRHFSGIGASSPPDRTPSPAPLTTLCEAEESEYFSGMRDVTREETLLISLALEVEATAATQTVFLERWGVDDKWDFLRGLQGRSWWVNGGLVAVLSPEVNKRVVEPFLALELAQLNTQGCPPRVNLSQICREASASLGHALEHAIMERELTDRFWGYLRNEVEPLVESRALHQMTVAVPPAMGVFLKGLPSDLLHECFLYHTVNCPLLAVGGEDGNAMQAASVRFNGLVAPAATTDAFVLPQKRNVSSADLQEMLYNVADEETSRLTELFREYDMLLSSNGYIRVPLAPVSRYVFTQLLCQTELPHALMGPFMRSHAHIACGTSDAAAQPRRFSRPTEEEVILGMKVTWAVERWAAALRKGIAVVPPVSVPIWNQDRSLRRENMTGWVRGRMQAARHQISLLFSPGNADTHKKGEMAHSASTESETSMTGGSISDPLRQRHSAALEALEQKLFSHLPASYRGSPTDWVGQALRDVTREQADTASNMVQLDVVPDALAGSHAAPQETLSADAFDKDSSRSSSEETSEGSEDTTSGLSTPTLEGTEHLLEQLAELEVILHDELVGSVNTQAREDGNPADASPRDICDSATLSTEKDLTSWCTRADIQNIAHNELFLQHAQLLESEMKHKN